MEHLFLSVFMLGLHTKAKVFASASRATREIVVNLICVWKHNPPSPHPVGNYFPFYTLKLFRGLPLLFYGLLCGTSNLPFKKVSGVPSHSILLKLFGNWSAVFSSATEPLISHLVQIELCWSRHDSANWQSLIPCRSWKAGKGLKSGCSRKRCKLDFQVIFEDRKSPRGSFSSPELAPDTN